MPHQPTTEPAQNLPPDFTAGAFTYSFLRELDTRGPCTLFLAERHHPKGRTREAVILKRPQDRQAQAARLRLLEEARLGLMLEHPAIPRVLDVAVYAGTPHLVMKYEEGLPLSRVLTKAARRHKPLSAPFAAYVAAEVADALHYAHTWTDERGQALQFVHRDVSPRNILLTDHGAVRLSDFGAARTVAPGRPLTDGPLLKGEVDYAAPEVLRLETPDARADIFSLGLVLLEMLTLQHLYDPPRQATPPTLRGLFAKLRGKVLVEETSWAEPAELAARAARIRPVDIERSTAHVPASLRAVVTRALRLNPDERYSTAAAMRDDLCTYLAELHRPHGPQELVTELRQVVAAAARQHGEVETSQTPVPVALQPKRSLSH